MSNWLDLNTSGYWRLSLPGTSWRSTEAGVKLCSSYRTRYWAHCIVFGCSWQVWCCWEKYLKRIMFLSSKQSTVFHYSGIRTVVLFLSDFVPTLDNDTFAIRNTQPSNMQGEHWTMTASSRQKFYFADSLSQPSFLKQQYRQMMPEPLQSHQIMTSIICCFHAMNAVFYLFKFWQEEITGVHDSIVLSNISYHM